MLSYKKVLNSYCPDKLIQKARMLTYVAHIISSNTTLSSTLKSDFTRPKNKLAVLILKLSDVKQLRMHLLLLELVTNYRQS